MAMPFDIGGSVESGFEAVRDTFVRNFDEFGEVGASFASTSRQNMSCVPDDGGLMGPMDVGEARIIPPTSRVEPLPLWLRLEMGASGASNAGGSRVCGAVSWF